MDQNITILEMDILGALHCNEYVSSIYSEFKEEHKISKTDFIKVLYKLYPNEVQYYFFTTLLY